MVDEKVWYRSKTIWGSLVTVLATVFGGLGYAVTPEGQAELVDAIVDLIGTLGAIIAIYGRLNATKVIS
ncbi:MAG: hypothetical protein AAGA53_01520 [Pseudomonadota bacterium]